MQAIQMNQGASPEPKPEIAMRDSGNDILEKSGKDTKEIAKKLLSVVKTIFSVALVIGFILAWVAWSGNAFHLGL